MDPGLSTLCVAYPPQAGIASSRGDHGIAGLRDALASALGASLTKAALSTRGDRLTVEGKHVDVVLLWQRLIA